MRSPPGLARSCSTIGAEMSSPCTRTPRSLSGSAMRPVPTPSSSAAPSPARVTSRSTTGSTTAGSDMDVDVASYPAAIRSSNHTLGTGAPSHDGRPGPGGLRRGGVPREDPVDLAQGGGDALLHAHRQHPFHVLDRGEPRLDGHA